MGTRSLIGKLNEDGSVTAIYCHWDGYPEHNGKILREHYKSNDKIGSLLNLGNISSLGKYIGKRHPFDSRDEAYSDWCTAYGRDRKEKGQEATRYGSKEAFLKAEGWHEFYYLWTGNMWLCYPNVDGTEVQIDLYNISEEAD